MNTYPITLDSLMAQYGGHVSPDGIVILCPGHGEKTPSCHITAGHDGKLLLTCFGMGCNRGSIIRSLRDKGMWPKDGILGNPPASDDEPISDYSQSDLDAMAATYALEWSDYTAHRCSVKPAWYKALDRKDTSVFYPAVNGDGVEIIKAKTLFRYNNGIAVPWPKGKRLFTHVNNQGKSTGFFPAPHPSQQLVITGGEEKALALIKYNIPAVSNTGGEQLSQQLAEYIVRTAGKDCLFTIWFDNDPSGRKKSTDAVTVLIKAGATQVRVVSWPAGTPDKHDICDQLRDHGPESLHAMYASAQPMTSRVTLSLTDLGNAERLVCRHGLDIGYSYTLKNWLTYNGKHWTEDEGDVIFAKMKDTIRAIPEECEHCDDEKQAERIYKHAIMSESNARFNSMEAMARGLRSVPSSGLDVHPMLLNCLDGTVDLTTGRLRKHDRGDWLSKITRANGARVVGCHTWETFLREIFHGDEELVHFMQKAVGYSLTGEVSEQCYFLLYGTGCNGKSTFLKTIRDMLHLYAGQASTELLMEQRNTGGPREDLIALRGKRLIAASEINDGRKLDESLVKQLSGSEPITARGLYQKEQEFPMQAKIFVAANYKPRITGQDDGTWRRVKLIPFTWRVPDNRKDADLMHKLSLEYDGIMQWSLKGCLDWQREGLKPPQCVLDATREYKQESDPYAELFDSYFIIDSSAREYTKSSTVYDVYRYWCSETGNKPKSHPNFGRDISARAGITRERHSGTGASLYRGLLINDAARALISKHEGGGEY